MCLATTALQLQLRPAQPLRPAAATRRANRTVAAAVDWRRAAAAAAEASPAAAAAPPPLASAALGCLAAALLAFAPLSVEAKELVQGYPRVVDGDTLDFSGTKVRLFGIDAPETKQSCKAGKGGDYLCGEKSKEALLGKIGKGKVECEQKNRDKYGRVVAVCSLNGEDLNGWLVDQGLAVAYRQYSKNYVPAEDAAKAAKRGIWSGSFEVPEQWRRDNPRGAAKTGADAVTPVVATTTKQTASPLPLNGCAIKGNINSKKEKVYHVPGGAFYDRTIIDLDQGERYFCTTAEAETAGWRASAR